jgi:hypothetical protein
MRLTELKCLWSRDHIISFSLLPVSICFQMHRQIQFISVTPLMSVTLKGTQE